MTVGDIVEETEPLLGAVPVYGPPVALVAVPWLLFGLLLAGPFALLATIVVLLVTTAALVWLIGALLMAPIRIIRSYRERTVPSRRHVTPRAVIQ